MNLLFSNHEKIMNLRNKAKKENHPGEEWFSYRGLILYML